jgi:hypothetical protein
MWLVTPRIHAFAITYQPESQSSRENIHSCSRLETMTGAV